MSETLNQNPENEGRNAEVRGVVRKMRDALQALRNTIPNADQQHEQENAILPEEAVENLVRVIAENKETLLSSGIEDPETLALIETAAAGMNIEDIKRTLNDAQDASDDLDVFTDEIAEMNTVIGPPEKLSVYERASKKLEEVFSEKFPKERMKEMAKKMGIELDDEDIGKLFRKVLSVIKAGFISAIEGFANMGNARWTMALEEARESDMVTSEQKKLLDDPSQLGKIRNQWNQLYKQWLARKRATKGPFMEPPPAIADVLKGIDMEKNSDNLLGVEGLTLNEEKKIESATSITYANKELSLHPEKIIFAGGERLFKETVEGVYITAPDANVENAKIRIGVNNQSTELTVKELMEKIEQANQTDEVILDTNPPLSLKAVS